MFSTGKILKALLPTLSMLLAAVAPSAHAQSGTPRIVLSTTLGDIVVELDAERAPESVANFLAYVDDAFYDGTVFHRVIEGFVIQGGGFTADFDRKPTRAPISNEAWNGLTNRRYSLSMARTNAPHSATSQFFINTSDNTNLDHSETTPRGWGYAVFGMVVDGHEVVDEINHTPTGAGGPFGRDVPLSAIVIEQARRLDDGRMTPEPAEGEMASSQAGSVTTAVDGLITDAVGTDGRPASESAPESMSPAE